MPTYVITGANRGLGLEFVAQLSKEKDITIFAGTRSLSNDLSELEALNKAYGNIRILECDTSSLDSISKFTQEIKKHTQKVDYLLNNAGINSVPQQDSLSIGQSDLQEQIAVNVLGPAKVTEGLVEVLKQGSVILNMTSGLGSMQKTKEMVPTKCTTYSLSKAALNMLTLHQAHDLGRKGGDGIGATVIMMDPGWVKTRMGGEGAFMEKHDSIRGMLEIIHNLRPTDNGRFYQSDGEQVPW